jgi:hypothetical protein
MSGTPQILKRPEKGKHYGRRSTVLRRTTDSRKFDTPAGPRGWHGEVDAAAGGSPSAFA